MKWYSGQMVLDQDEKHLMEERGSKYNLTISNLTLSDFGNYSCEGSNKMGRTRQFVEISCEDFGIYQTNSKISL